MAKIYIHSPSHPSNSQLHIPSIYFLLKSEYMMNGTQDLEWVTPIVYEIETAPSFEYIKQHGPLDYFVMSVYSWNEVHMRGLAALVKAEWPDCKIIAGGYQVSKEWEQYDFIDHIIKGDGEGVFSDVIDGRITTRFSENYLTEWVGSAVIDNSAEIKEMIASSIITFGKDIAYVYETNRGCPYSCTFCAWGDPNRQKIRVKELSVIEKELTILLDANIDILRLADANFGMLPNDPDIVDIIVRNKGTLKNVDISWAKNHKHLVMALTETLANAGLLARYKYGLQDINESVGVAIKRAEKVPWRKAFTEYKKSSIYKTVPLRLDLIYGLATQTKDMFFNQLQEFVKLDIDIGVIPLCQVFPNTELADPAYQEKYGIKARNQRVQSIPAFIPKEFRADIFAKTNFTHLGDDYMVDNVVSTDAATPDDIHEMVLYSGFVMAMYSGGICEGVNVDYPSLYTEFFMNPKYRYSHGVYNRAKNYLTNNKTSSPLNIPFTPTYHLTPGGFVYCSLLFNAKVFYAEIEEYLGEELRKDVMTYQNTEFTDIDQYVFTVGWRGSMTPMYKNAN